MRFMPAHRASLLCLALMAMLLIIAARPVVAAGDSPVAPGISASPPAGEMIEPGRPIVVKLSGDLALPATTPPRAFIDTVEVPVTRREGGFEISVPKTLGGGLHQVRVVVAAVVGKTREAQWSIQTAAPAELDRSDASVTVSTNARKTLYEGDAFEVHATGPAGGKATATQGNFSFDLTETSPGQYSGTHDVQRADHSAASPTRVRIALPNGQSVGNRSATDAKVLGQFFIVRIDSPANGTKVPFTFVIKGRTRPNARISITPQIGARQSPPMQSPYSASQGSTIQQVQTRGMGGWDIKADSRGHFQQDFGFPVRLINLPYTFVFTATDADGNQAIPRTLYVIMSTKPGTDAAPSASPTPAPRP